MLAALHVGVFWRCSRFLRASADLLASEVRGALGDDRERARKGDPAPVCAYTQQRTPATDWLLKSREIFM